MEGSDVDYVDLPVRCPHPADVDVGRGALEIFSQGSLCFFQVFPYLQLTPPTAALSCVSFGIGSLEWATSTHVRQTYQVCAPQSVYDSGQVLVPSYPVWLVTIDAHKTVLAWIPG